MIELCHLYPQSLPSGNVTGNLLILKYDLQKAGLPVHISKIDIGDTFDPMNYHLIMMGGEGRYYDKILERDFLEKATKLHDYLQADELFLGFPNSFDYLERAKVIPFSLEKVINSSRYHYYQTFDSYFRTKIVGTIRDFSVLKPGKDATFFGEVLYHSPDVRAPRTEGIRYHQSILTNFTGSLLIENLSFRKYLVEMLILRFFPYMAR